MLHHLSITRLIPWDLIKHNEHPDSLGESRHPLVVCMNAPTAIAILLTWLWNGDSLNWASHASFGALLFLFVSSATYHHFAASKPSRIIDQSAISAFILMTVLPFVHESKFAVSTIVLLLGIKLVIKVRDRESRSLSALLFLAIGAVSTFMYLFLGETASGIKFSWPFMLSLGFFIGKLSVYASDFGQYVSPEHFGTPECGHTLLLPAVPAFMYWVLTDAPV